MTDQKPKWRFCLALSVFFILMMYLCTLTALGAGQPSPNNAKPLGFMSCTLLNGVKTQTGTKISLTPEFSLLFDKNVVDAQVWDQNKACVSLQTADGKIVPANVTKIDDTIDFSHRQQIFLKPAGVLSAGSSYKIYISPKLIAKNGVSVLSQTTSGKGVTIPFVAQAVVKSDVIPAAAASSKRSSDAPWNLPVLDMALGAVIAGWIAWEIVRIRRRPKKELEKSESKQP